MATRADFYIRKNNKLEFLGCTSNDYYGEFEKSKDENHFRKSVSELLRQNNSIDGKWYWPWKNSFISDEVFIFDVRPAWLNKHKGVLLAKVHTEKDRKEPILAFLDYRKRYQDAYMDEESSHYSKNCIFIEMPNII